MKTHHKKLLETLFTLLNLIDIKTDRLELNRDGTLCMYMFKHQIIKLFNTSMDDYFFYTFMNEHVRLFVTSNHWDRVVIKKENIDTFVRHLASYRWSDCGQ